MLWSSHGMIHHANHVRPKIDGIKTGGHFGQTGTVGDLYRHFRLDRNALAASVKALTAGRKTTAEQEALREMAKRAGSEPIEVKASHAVFMSQPAAVAALIEKAAATLSD